MKSESKGGQPANNEMDRRRERHEYREGGTSTDLFILIKEKKRA